MKAIILNDGEGTRLRPATCTMPKSMLPVVGRPICEHIIRLLRRNKISDIYIVSDYMESSIKNHLLKSNIQGVRLSFISTEDISSVMLEDDVFIINGSTITDIDILKILKELENKNADALLVTRTHPDYLEYGIVTMDEDKNIIDYNRATYPVFSSMESCFMGMMLIKKGFNLIDKKNFCAMAESICKSGKKVSSYSTREYICDVNDMDSYFRVNRDFLDKKIDLPFPCDEKEPGVWIDEGAKVMRGSVIMPPVYIGKNTVIDRGARIEDHTVIGDDCTVKLMASIKRAVIMNNSKICTASSVRGSLICTGCEVGSHSAIYESAVLAEGSILGQRTTVKPSVRIWPKKYINDESVISSNVVWENVSCRSLFFDGCASGVINTDITPEFASFLAGSVTTLLGKKIGVSTSESAQGNMIKNALISGILSCGGAVYDFGEEPLPITRSGVRFYNLDGGLSISTYTKDDECFLAINIINGGGADVEDETLFLIEGMVQSGEVKRAQSLEIKETIYLFEYKLYYLRKLINSVEKCEKNIKILVNASSMWAKRLLESAASDLSFTIEFTNTSSPYEFASEVTKGGYNFGAIIDYKCEKLTLVASSGYLLSEFDYSALISLLIMKSHPAPVIYTPLYSPDSIDSLAQKYNAKVVRTKISPPNLMNELTKHSEEPFTKQFIFNFDAVGSLIFLASHSANLTSIDDLLTEIPKTYTKESFVSCNYNEQNEKIRNLTKKHNLNNLTSDKGVKVPFENGWAIIIPKKEDSSIKVISHSYKEEYASEIADICTDEIIK